jgi:hypothetical protein
MTVDPKLENDIKSKIHKSLGWSRDVFPEVTPVSLRLRHLENLHFRGQYFVTEKKVGVKALVYHGTEGLFWYGKDGKIHPLHLDNLRNPESKDQFTILQAVWVVQDKCFYVEDVAFLNGASMVWKGIVERLTLFQSDWLNTRTVSPKDRFKIVPVVYEKARNLITPSRNLIFAEQSTFFTCGKNKELWEWKDPQTISIDLRLHWRKTDGMFVYSLWGLSPDGQTENHFCDLPNLTSADQPKAPNGIIVECNYDHDRKVFSRSEMAWVNGLWTPTKIKKEKQQPDFIKDIWPKVSILKENITFATLVRCFHEQGGSFMDEEGIEWVSVDMY